MSCHDIGRALNYVQEEIIEQYENGKLDKDTTKSLLIRAREAIGFCDGNVGEATASFDKCYCSDCMRKVDEGEDLFALYIGYPWYQKIDEYLAEHDMVGTVLCEECFERMLNTMGMTSEEIEALKVEQRQERANQV